MADIPETLENYDTTLFASSTTVSDSSPPNPAGLFRLFSYNDEVYGTTNIPCHLWNFSSLTDIGELRFEKPSGSTGEIYSGNAVGGKLWMFAYSCGAPIFSYDGISVSATDFADSNNNWRCRGNTTDGTTIWVGGEYPGKTSTITAFVPATETATIHENVGTHDMNALYYDSGSSVLYALEEDADPTNNPATLHQLNPSTMGINWSVNLTVNGPVLGLTRQGANMICINRLNDKLEISAVDISSQEVVWAHVWNTLNIDGRIRDGFFTYNNEFWIMTDSGLHTLRGRRLKLQASIPEEVVDRPVPPIVNNSTVYCAVDNSVYRLNYIGNPLPGS